MRDRTVPEVLSLCVERGTGDRLEALATELDVTKSWVVRRAIKCVLAEPALIAQRRERVSVPA